MAHNIMLRLPYKTSNVILNHVQRRFMPVNVPPTATGKRRFRLSVETDPEKLVNYCCGLNYHVDEPPIKLKPDNEYPDWLWTLRLDARKPSWELERGSREYYEQLAREGIDSQYKLKMASAKPTKTVGKVLLDRQEYIKRLRFAALAHLEDDVGLPLNTMDNQRWIDPRKVRMNQYYMPLNENKVLYKDEIEGNIAMKNFRPSHESSFSQGYRSVAKRPSIMLKATLDRKRRHRHSVY